MHGGQWSCVDAILNKIAGYSRVCGFERPWSNKISCNHATATKLQRSAAALKCCQGQVAFEALGHDLYLADNMFTLREICVTFMASQMHTQSIMHGTGCLNWASVQKNLCHPIQTVYTNTF